MNRFVANSGSIATPLMPAWPLQKRSDAVSGNPLESFTPSKALMALDGSRTERPPHFSVKNIVPSGRNAMSQAPSRPDITEVLVKPGAPLGLWAAAEPARLAEASKTQGNKKR